MKTKRITCSKCKFVKVATKFFGKSLTCKECLYICHKCNGNMGCNKICECRKIKIDHKKNRYLQLLSNYDLKYQMFGKKIYSTLVTNNRKFVADRNPLFSSDQCKLIVKWMSRSKYKFEPIDFDHPEEAKSAAKRYDKNIY